MRILITGSRYWSDREAVRVAISEAIGDRPADAAGWRAVVIHGDAPGADTIAGEVAPELGCRVEAYPARWHDLGKKAGPIRNQLMVDRGADVCLAFPHSDSRGTRDCMSRAAAAGIPVIDCGGTR